MIAELQEPLRREMLEVLLPHQRELLYGWLIRRQIRISGLPQMISAGIFGANTRPAPDEFERLLHSSKRIADRLDKERQEMDQLVEEAFFEILTPAQSRKLKKLIGPPPGYHEPWVDLTLLQLELGDCELHEFEETIGRLARVFCPLVLRECHKTPHKASSGRENRHYHEVLGRVLKMCNNTSHIASQPRACYRQPQVLLQPLNLR